MSRPENSNSFPQLPSGTVKELNAKLKNIGKPTVFIGSSLESRPVAEKIKSCFSAEQFQVDIWFDGIFGKTRTSGGDMSNMEWLKNFTDIYDFAIFIFVPEDELVSSTRNDMESEEPRKALVTRHNVVFEFGMFLGRIGVKRSFILFDEEVKQFIDLFFTDLKENLDDKDTKIEINTDFNIELYPYKGNYTRYLKNKIDELPFDAKSIEAAVERIKIQMIKNFEAIEIGFLPATTLAFGYHNNFVDTFVRNANILKSQDSFPPGWFNQGISAEKLEELRKTIQGAKKVKLKIVIPTSIEGARQEKFIPDFDRNKFSQENFPGKNRSITLLRRLANTAADTEEWIIYDVPTTLNSSIEAIEQLTKHEDIRELLKEKELRNFRKSMEHKMELAKNDKQTHNIADLVEFITYDQFKEETR